jgi:hypothetical protein
MTTKIILTMTMTTMTIMVMVMANKFVITIIAVDDATPQWFSWR